MLRIPRVHARPVESYGWNEPQRRSLRRLTGHGLSALGAATVLAIISGFIGSLFHPGFAYRSLHAVAGLFRPAPSVGDRIVDEYAAETQTADLWRRRPLIFPNSTEYMKAHFASFDPRRVHPYVKTDFKLWVPDLTHAAPVYAGMPIEVLGQVLASNVGSPPNRANVEWILQLTAITVTDGIVYCRVTKPLSWRPTDGALIRARGVVLGAGSIVLTDGRFAQAAYMACSAVAPPPRGYRRFSAFIVSHPRSIQRMRELLSDPQALSRLSRRLATHRR